MSKLYKIIKSHTYFYKIRTRIGVIFIMHILKNLSASRQPLYGFSALFIALVHSKLILENSPSFMEIKKTGYLGVDIFLLLAGMGMYTSFKKGNKKIIPFYLKRIPKVFVPMLLVNLIYFPLVGVPDTKLMIYKILGFFWLPNVGLNSWFIFSIISFYLAYPFLHLLTTIKNNKTWYHLSYLILFVISLSLTVLNFKTTMPIPIIDMYLARIPIFIIGCYIAPFIMNEKKYHPLKSTLIFIVSFAAMAVSFLAYKLSILEVYKYTPVPVLISIVFTISLSLTLAFIFTILKDLLKSKLILGFFSFFGTYSLYIYIFFEKTQELAPSLLGITDKTTPSALIIFLIITTIESIIAQFIINKLFSILTPKSN